MGEPAFTDPRTRPTEEAILAALGRTAGTWQALWGELRGAHPGLAQTWRYYADGKSWLLKASRGTKTVFWLQVEQGAFRLSFYFPERLAPALLRAGLSKALSDELRSGAPTGKLRRVALAFGPRRGVSDVLRLVALKQALK